MQPDLSEELNKIHDLTGLQTFLADLRSVEGKFGGRTYTKEGRTGGVTLNAITKRFEKIVRIHREEEEGGLLMERSHTRAGRIELTKDVASRILELGALSMKLPRVQNRTTEGQEGMLMKIRRVFGNLLYSRGKVLADLTNEGGGAFPQVISITHKHLEGYHDSSAQKLIYHICKKVGKRGEGKGGETTPGNSELLELATVFLRQSSTKKKGKWVETFYDRRGTSRERSLLLMAKELFETNDPQLQAAAASLVVQAASLTHEQGMSWVASCGLPKRYEKLLRESPGFLEKIREMTDQLYDPQM